MAALPEHASSRRAEAHRPALARDLLTDRQAEVLAARERLIERLKRMAG